MNTKNKSELIKAFQIGILCVGAYMVRYYMKSVLSVASPEMLATGLFTKELLGYLSSAYMLAYAIGQLFNGIIGDIVNPKRMISGGMLLCGISSIAFSFCGNSIIQIILFALMGFSLSMLRGPLVKTISENTAPNHSRVICTFFSFAGFSGPLIASLISMFFNWKKTFIVAGLIAFVIGVLVYLFFTSMEKKGHITYTSGKSTNIFKNVFKIFTLKHFVFYIFVGALAEISASSISFWIPTYFTEKLLLSENFTKVVYTATAIIKSVTPFLTLFLFNMFKEKDIKMIRFSFLFATAFFCIMRFADSTYINIASLIMAQIAIGSASSLLWSIYIPSQRESGMVSTINGVLDFSGYVFAAVANLLFAHSMESLGWNGIITVWISMTAIGFIVAMITRQDKEK